MIVSVGYPIVGGASDVEAENAVNRVAAPLLFVRVYLSQRQDAAPCTVWEIAEATCLSLDVVRDCVRALLRSGFNAEVYDAVCIFPSAFEGEV